MIRIFTQQIHRYRRFKQILVRSQIRAPCTYVGELPATLIGIQFFQAVVSTNIIGTLLAISGREWEEVSPEGMRNLVINHTVHVLGCGANILYGVEGFHNTQILRMYIPFHVPRICHCELCSHKNNYTLI